MRMTGKEFEKLKLRMERIRRKEAGLKVREDASMTSEFELPRKTKSTMFKTKGKMSKTEELYERSYLSKVPHKFEGITLKMANGHRYTPDFYEPPHELHSKIRLHEVKGSYRLHSYGRAKMAFDQCKVEFPEYEWVWATKTKEGWDIR